VNKELREERIKLLRRQEDRKKKLPILLDHLNTITKNKFSENEVLTLEQIDEHQIQLNSSDFDFNYLNISFPKSKVAELQRLLITLNENLSKNNYFEFSHYSTIAVLKIKTIFIIEKLQDLIKLDGYTICVYEQNYKNGLRIDLYKEYWYLDDKASLIPIYELRIFGKQWIKLITEKL
jgi:hypothetical protein